VLAADDAQTAEPTPQRPRTPSLPHAAKRLPGPIAPMTVSTMIVATLVFVVAGVPSGPATTGTPLADAAVLRHVAAVLKPKPGTILIQKRHVTRTWNHGRHQSFDLELADQTPDGPGPQNSLYITTEPGVGPNELAVSGGDQEVYLKATNTIYITSSWGSYIAKGSKPGSYMARRGRCRRSR
jgi:hypothetical protein